MPNGDVVHASLASVHGSVHGVVCQENKLSKCGRREERHRWWTKAKDDEDGKDKALLVVDVIIILLVVVRVV